MLILHTSDWHLGRSFHRVGMLGAQAAVIDQLVEVVRAERVDVVLVSGDVYDRAIPSVDVVALLDDALARLVGAGATVILTGGNHDSAVRLSFAARLLESARVHIRTDARRCGEPVVIEDGAGPVAFYPLPYLEPALAAVPLAAPATHAGVLGAALDAVRSDLATRPPGTRSVVSAHSFVVGGQVSASERDITVGGVASVPLTLFAGFDYVALGHLHGRQQLAESVRYSGSPLAFSFSEHAHVKGSYLVRLGREGLESVEPVDSPVPRRLALLRGNLEELLWRGDLAVYEQSWCQVTLTDPHRPARAMDRLRARFPHTLELRFEPVDDVGRAVLADRAYTQRLAGRDELSVCTSFLDHVRSRPADDRERAWLSRALTACRVGDLDPDSVSVLPVARARAGEVPAPEAHQRADRLGLDREVS
ncbi:MAG: exonuclease SbcCD subunit D [Kineosporiaceae bacterium]|nr:exonuclease SbcCD subunit D [Kineosporiaceae bacterium]